MHLASDEPSAAVGTLVRDVTLLNDDRRATHLISPENICFIPITYFVPIKIQIISRVNVPLNDKINDWPHKNYLILMSS